MDTYNKNHPETPNKFPKQEQPVQPGSQKNMNPEPVTVNPSYTGCGKLLNRVAIVTGGDSGIGQAVCIAFAKEGADIVVPYYSEEEDAKNTEQMVTNENRKCILVKCDLKKEESANIVVKAAIDNFKKIDILVNNIAVQYTQNSIKDITREQLYATFETNFFSYFYMSKVALPYMKPSASIINTTSVTAYKGSGTMIDYSATKGAIVSFTRSLSLSLAKEGIRVNAVAPGPVWTPLVPASMEADQIQEFGKEVPLGRAAQPFELAPTYVYLASDDSAYVTGQVLHVNGGVYL